MYITRTLYANTPRIYGVQDHSINHYYFYNRFTSYCTRFVRPSKSYKFNAI